MPQTLNGDELPAWRATVWRQRRSTPCGGANAKAQTARTAAKAIAQTSALRIPCGPRRRKSAGSSAAGTNFAAVPNPTTRPLMKLDRNATSAHTKVAETIASLELAFSTYAVYGH